ncbi:N-6 DNA methylase [Deinococcus aquaticus]|uniref:site-specific DNA-methyltransferase (adenine-specific) n=2 Tax=Deinococcus aquaticus TaxID=328692 RepID=A0ABY7V162_9DEIO|nr:type ISP restriction/modification enzyme [Deinococcus aquaticus]WDA58921.1 N-6 DNA methylase [Deinococcus aquaticus]
MPASTPNAETAVQTYFHEVRAVHATGAGVAETSYYPALFGLLGSIGATLKPRVHAVNHLSNLGAGIPDGGFFDAGQLQRGQEQDVLRGQLPSRGALEVKSPAEQVADIATGTQVAKYLDLYGLVLVTNLRAFALYTRENGQPKLLEHMELAPNAAAFWTLLRDPDAQSAHAAPLAEFLTRALQTGAPLSTPESVAWFLASYAREAKHRLSHTPLEALAPLKRALSEALDLQFQDEQGERFFRSTLIQTLWYGLFSAWVLHSAQQPQLPFNWRAAAWELHLPVMQRLFGELANPSAQHSLNLTDLLDRTAATLARVDVTTFTQKFQGDAVQYFYEPFLAAYDPELRKQFGVWYTPPEVVQYMVERVDTALREQLNLPLGLADPSVYVLDPATGTGSYLTATLDRIWRTLKAQPDFDDATLDDLRAAVKERLIGFEIMPAPYVIAHLRLSQQLARYGVTLRPSDPAHPAKPERAAVYLTNALTNWHTIPEPLSMPELQAEQDAAQHVKKSAPILVILGNPPYSAFNGTSQTEEGDLIAHYKRGLVTEWGIRKFNLDDLYVRFFRIAERKVAQGGRGIVSFISPSSYLSDPSFVVMRSALLNEFNHLTFDNLNGDSRETGKRTPDGQPDPSIFSTPSNRAGIRSGTAVSLLVKTGLGGEPAVQYREFWGAGKGTQLLTALQDGGPAYYPAAPTPANRYTFRPEDSSADYQSWPKVVELAGEAPINGLMEKRGGGLVGFDRAAVEAKMRPYFDSNVTWENYQIINPELSKDASGYDAEATRGRVRTQTRFQARNIVPYLLRAFEVRQAYFSDHSTLWNRSRPTLWAQLPGNSFFVTRPAAAASDEGTPFYFTSNLGDNDALRGHAYYIPVLWRSEAPASDGLFASSEPTLRANLSAQARAYLAALGAPDPDASPAGAALLWHHALAVGFSGAYLSEHAGGIAGDWPRIPLPGSLSALTESAALGARVAALLDDPQVPTRAELGAVGRLKRVGEDVHGYEVRAGWGAVQRGNVVMPGRGRTTERAADGLPPGLGDRVLDVALNDAWVWENVPVPVWEYTIGGYQVMKKWLSYREFGVLGRALTLDEAREVSRMARRLAELVLLGPDLDASYARVQGDVWAWGAER